MTARFAIELLVYGGIIPAVIAITVAYLVRQLLSEMIAERYALAAGFSLAAFAGYCMLPEWAPMWPERHWHFLPYLGAMAAMMGPIGLARGVAVSERFLLSVVLAMVTAWMLVPTWQRVDRQFYVPLLAAYLLVPILLLDPLCKRVSARVLLLQFSIAAVSVAVVIAADVNLPYGQFAGIAAAALMGCFVADCFHSSKMMARGLIPAYAIVVGGIAFTGFIELRQPLVGMLLLPAAPVALWATACGPAARLHGTAAIAVQTLVFVTVLAAGITMIETAL